MTLYLLCIVLFLVGVYCVVVKRNLIKIILGLSISEYAVFLFFVLVGYRMRGRAPILDGEHAIKNIVDPLPQALVLTAIVIGLAVTALIASMAIRVYEKYGTFDIRKIRELKG